jgi:RNA polymerase sigma factor (sigma-70 family)
LQPLTFLDAEDLTSIVICELYKRIDTFTSLDHLEAYFRKGLKHRAISRKRGMDAQSRGGGNVISASDPELSKSPKKNRIGAIEAALKARVEPYINDAGEDDSAKFFEEINVVLSQESIDLAELKKIIFDCATELSEKEREMIGYIYENKSQPKIAEAMKKGVGQITAERDRIYKKLQRKLLLRLGKQGLKDYGIKTA